MMSPNISVVMSVYDEPEEWLRGSIESILNQTFSDFELIVVNDNPSKELNSILIKQYAAHDQRIVYVQNERNIRLAASLNRGFSLARGKYIARMDSDDIACPNRLQVQYDFMEEHTEAGVCGAWIRFIGDIGLLSARTKRLPASAREIKTGFLFYNPLIHPTAFFRKSEIERLMPLYEEECRSAQDYVLWGRLLESGIQLLNIKQILLHYRVSRAQISSKLKGNQNNVANVLQLKALEKNGIVLSDEEKAAYIRIMNLERFSDADLLCQAEPLLLKVKGMLCLDDSFDMDLLDKMFHDQWVNCFLNAYKRKKLLIPFFNSSVFKFKHLNMRDFVKVMISIL